MSAVGVTATGVEWSGVMVLLLACGAAVSVAWRAWKEPDDRLPCSLITVSILLAVGGFATFSTLLDGEAAVLPNVLFLGSYPFVVAGLILMIRRRSALRSIGHWLDALMVAGAFGLLTAALVGPTLVQQAKSKGQWTAFLVFAYPVLDVVAITTCVLFVAQAAKSSRALNGAGLAAGAMALADLIPLLEARYGVPGRLATPLTCTAYLLLIWAMRRPFPSTIANVDTNTVFRTVVIPGLSVAAAVVVVLMPGHGVVMDALAVVAIGAAFTRIALAFREVRILERTRHEARTDELTNLPNRRALHERLQVLTSATNPLVLLLMDLDSFKEINDTLGHEAGDQVLRTIASRLRRMVSSLQEVELFRLGGDEFAVISCDVTRAAPIAEILQRTVSAHMVVDGVNVQQQLSIGSAMFPVDAATPSDLLRLADTAMYRAKTSRSGYAVWEAGTTSEWSSLELTSLVRDAIERRQIELHYQPQVSLVTGEIHGVEALLRLSIDGRPISPLTVVRIAEQISLQALLTEAVIERALRQQRAWSEAGLNLLMSINISTADVSSRDFAERLRRIMVRTNARPRLLCLEVTEESLLGDPAVVHSTIAGIRSFGVQIAMDDFGVGFSALTNLRQLEIDELKLDRSFVTDLDTSPRTKLLVQNVVDLARRLNLRVVAEGIETAAERDAVAGTGIEFGQGYAFSRAIPGEQVPAWVAALTAERPLLRLGQ